MPCSVIGSCEIDKHSSCLHSGKAILSVLCEQRALIYGRPSMSESRQLLWEQWVDGLFDTSVD